MSVTTLSTGHNGLYGEVQFSFQTYLHSLIRYILLRASEVGSPMNHLGSGQRRDTGQGPFSPFTGGLDLTPTGSLQPEWRAY